MEATHALPPETVESFDEAFSGADSLAIVGAPWSGRTVLLDRAAAVELDDDGADHTRVDLDGPVEEAPDLPDSGRALVADCHHLYRRSVDGFDALETFLDELVTTDATVVTTWNETAWSYLVATTAVEQAVDEVFEIPPLDSVDALKLLRETTDIDDPEAVLVEYAQYTASTDTLIDRARLRFRNLYRGTVVDHLDGLVSDAAGNPRAIRALFDCRIERGEHGCPGEPNVGYDASYLLWLVLSNEGLTVADLAGRVDYPVEFALASLAREGVVTIEDGLVTVPPAAFGDVREHLEGWRLRW